MTIRLDLNIVPWMVRHAAYLITRCRVWSCGKTLLQLIKGWKSLMELVPFGETVMLKSPKASHAVGSVEERRDRRLGRHDDSIRHVVNWHVSRIYKKGTIKRKPDGEQWSQEMIKNMAGSLQQPEPGVAET